MTPTQNNVLVLKNGTGEYYVLPQDLLEQYRVPAEHTAAAERVFEAATADDVAGHLSLNFSKIVYAFAGTLVNASPAFGALSSNVGDNAVKGAPK